MKHLFTIMLFVICLTINIQAQTTVTAPVPPVVVTTIVQAPVPTGALTPPTAKFTTEILASSSTKVVKGAPFSAEGVSESVQILADGNRITRRSGVKMYRDGEGRFRREGGASSSGGGGFGYTTSGSMVSVYGMKESISIFDPVENIRYILNPTDKTARRFTGTNTLPGNGNSFSYNSQTPIAATAVSPAVTSDGMKKLLETNDAQKANVVVMPNMVTGMMTGGKTESLGSKTFEGVEAEGTRTVTTIAAGAIGNERPIEIVYEKWFSKELDLIVYSRHYDPRFGEQIYRLVNISRNEPDRSLFTVPNDYKVVTEQPMKIYTTVTPATKPQ